MSQNPSKESSFKNYVTVFYIFQTKVLLLVWSNVENICLLVNNRKKENEKDLNTNKK